LKTGVEWLPEPGRMQILGVISGKLSILSTALNVSLSAGEFCLVPAALSDAALRADSPVAVLRTLLGEQLGE